MRAPAAAAARDRILPGARTAMACAAERQPQTERHGPRDAIAVREDVFLVPRMQQVGAGQGQFQLVGGPPAQACIQLHVAPHFRVRQRADLAQLGGQHPAIGQVHHRTDEAVMARIIAGLRGTQQTAGAGLEMQPLAQRGETRVQPPRIIDRITAPCLQPVRVPAHAIAPQQRQTRGRELDGLQVVVDVVERRDRHRRARGQLGAPARLVRGQLLAPD